MLVTAALGAEHRGLLLRLANEQDAFFGGELVAVGGGHVILALPLLERHDRHLLLLGELVHAGEEGLGDGIHQNAGGELVAEMEPEEGSHPGGPLQCGHVNVEVHTVDALHFQGDVLAENLGDTAWWYAHFGSG